jgi:DNA-binding transcriptional MerR regulator
MQIGDFARSCRLSVKALRHYDDVGLLRPDFVDPETGYRYYRREQARAALAIAMLRSIGLPIPAVKALLTGDEHVFADVLRQERDRLAREEARIHHALRSVDHLLRAQTLMPRDVVLRDEPARCVVVQSAVTTLETHVGDTASMVAALLATLEHAGVASGTPIGCLLPDAMDGSFAVEVFATIAAPRAIDGLEVRHLAACTCAVATHVGAYESLGVAHHGLLAWTQEHGYRAAGVLREIYIDDPDEVPEETRVTEVVLPVAPIGR